MVKCESARPAVREGKAVMDAARNNFPNNRDIEFYLKEINMKEEEEQEEIKQYLKKVYAKAQTSEEAIQVLKQAEDNQDIDGILAVMAQHRDSTGVQEQGCEALGNMAINPATRPIIAEKGGIEAAFRAMTQHSHHEDVQVWGCYVMCRMVFCESARPAIREGKALMDAARNNFPDNDDIKRYLKKVYGKI